MDGKNNHGIDTMIGISRLSHVLRLICLCIAVIALASVPSFAADLLPYETSSAEITSVVAGIQVMQIGGDALLVRLRGHEMPLPETISKPGDAKLVLKWSGVRFALSTEKRDWWDDYDWDVLKLSPEKQNKWWKQYDQYEIIDRISADNDGTGVVMTFSTPRPMTVSKIEGVAGSDSCAIMLRTYGTAPSAPVKTVQQRPMSKNDPLSITVPVTLKIRDGDVKSVFRMLAEQRNINLLLDPSVPDMNVTLSFKDVPYNEAFSYLLRMTDLNYSMMNDMLVIGKAESLGKTLGKEVVRAYRISYAVDAHGEVRGDLTATLTSLVDLSTVPTLDNRTRTLYVTATEEQHAEVAKLLEKLDHPGRQIMIQARIMEVNDSGLQELETLMSAVYDKWLLNFSNQGITTGYVSSNVDIDTMNLQWPIAGRLPGSTSTWGEMIADSNMRFLNAGLRAIESKGNGKVLANPSVITIDGQQARVELTRNIKYASGVDSNGNTTFSDVQSGPKLTFTPVIGRNGIITIDVSIETGEVIQFHTAGNGARSPETSSRRVSTLVRVRDGEPFAVGGLYQESKVKSKSRIPVLGYIPILGDLFTSRSDQHHKSEVAMIVIPYVLDIPDAEMPTFDLEKAPLNRQ